MAVYREDFAVYVFSFNRAPFLKNCLESISKLAPDLSVQIVDDGSDDPETRSFLDNISPAIPVISNTLEGQVEHKTGGLAGCMNLAMQDAREKGYKYAIFIQDDMQIVRRINSGDFDDVEKYFSGIDRTIQISTTFVRRLSSADFFEKYYLDKVAGAYVRHAEMERGKSSFSDTGVFSVQRFFDIFANFEIGEGRNSAKARGLGLVCGRSINPFMCWLPYPVAYRGKAKSFKHRFFEHFGRSGYYPIEYMSDSSAKAFLMRDPMIVPIMEDFLSAPSSPRLDVWSTGGGEYNFDCYDGIVARAYRAARTVRRRLRRTEN